MELHTFQYKAIDAAGETISQSTVASTEASAVEALTRLGYSVFEIAKVTQDISDKPPSLRTFAKQNITDFELSELCGAMQSMLERNISIEDSLEITAQTAANHRVSTLLFRVLKILKLGKEIDQAFEAADKTLPIEFNSLIRAGVASNRLDSMFREAKIYFQSRSITKSKVLASLAYPLFLLIASIFVFIVITMKLVPTLYQTVIGTNTVPTGMIKNMNALSIWLTEYWMIAVIALCLTAIVLFAFRKILTTRIISSIPYFRRLHAEEKFGKIATMISVFLNSGMDLETALSEARFAIGSGSHSAALDEALVSIRRGQSATIAFRNKTSVPTAFGRLYALGERTNNLPEMMKLAGETLTKSHQRSTSRLTGLLTPVLTLVVGGMIALVVQVLISVVLEVSQIAI